MALRNRRVKPIRRNQVEEPKVGCIYRNVARLCFEDELPDYKDYEAVLSRGNLEEIERFVKVRDIFLMMSTGLKQILIKDNIRLPNDFAEVMTYSEEPEYDLEEIIIEIGLRKYSKSEKAVVLLETLKVVHDEWVRIHAERFFSENKREKCRFLQFELLGPAEVGLHRIFIDEIFTLLGLMSDEAEITKQYWKMQEAFIKQNGIWSREDLVGFIMKADYNSLARDICDILRTDRTVAEIMADN